MKVKEESDNFHSQNICNIMLKVTFFFFLTIVVMDDLYTFINDSTGVW